MTGNNYWLYLLVASLTIASPGPGVILTLSNTLKYGLYKSIYGILGITFGMLFIGILASSGLGALLLALPNIFNSLKIIGALYLLYLAWKIWTSKVKQIENKEKHKDVKNTYLFKDAFILTLSNPKPLVFFTAFFPQFINPSDTSYNQFMILISTFCFLIILIHFFYAAFATYANKLFFKENKMSLINEISSVIFMIFSFFLFKSAIESYKFK